MTTTTEQSPAETFAGAVRLALSDLPADEVDDLTDGLEADLAERADDEESPDFGDPVSYASELRSAAGLPPRHDTRPGSVEGVIGAAWRDLSAELRRAYSHPAIARIAGFFVALRPVWWLVRAWAFYGVLAWAFGVPTLQLTPLTFVIGVGSLITSVQFGRGNWLPRPWMRKALLGVNVILVILSPIILLGTTAVFGSQVDAAYASGQQDGIREQTGLTYNGRQITNLFAYDSEGKPLTAVQLYDQTGRPLYTVPDAQALTTDQPYLVPYNGIHGRGGWNVYPLEFVTQNQLNENGEPKSDAQSTPSVLRDLLVPPLTIARTSTGTGTGTGSTAAPTATPTPGPVPTSTPTGAATATPTATPTPAG